MEYYVAPWQLHPLPFESIDSSTPFEHSSNVPCVDPPSAYNVMPSTLWDQKIKHYKPPPNPEQNEGLGLPGTERYLFNGHDVTEYFAGSLTYMGHLRWDNVGAVWRFPAYIEETPGIVDYKNWEAYIEDIPNPLEPFNIEGFLASVIDSDGMDVQMEQEMPATPTQRATKLLEAVDMMLDSPAKRLPQENEAMAAALSRTDTELCVDMDGIGSLTSGPKTPVRSHAKKFDSASGCRSKSPNKRRRATIVGNDRDLLPGPPQADEVLCSPAKKPRRSARFSLDNVQHTASEQDMDVGSPAAVRRSPRKHASSSAIEPPVSPSKKPLSSVASPSKRPTKSSLKPASSAKPASTRVLRSAARN